jgi:succinate dehydrogenase flavin-adding protein (antitoxin of CptAB toxin-antitoxin module)
MTLGYRGFPNLRTAAVPAASSRAVPARVPALPRQTFTGVETTPATRRRGRLRYEAYRGFPNLRTAAVPAASSRAVPARVPALPPQTFTGVETTPATRRRGRLRYEAYRGFPNLRTAAVPAASSRAVPARVPALPPQTFTGVETTPATRRRRRLRYEAYRGFPNPRTAAVPAASSRAVSARVPALPPQAFTGVETTPATRRRRRLRYEAYRGFPNPHAACQSNTLTNFHAQPIWKSAIQQVWKPAVRAFPHNSSR